MSHNRSYAGKSCITYWYSRGYFVFNVCRFYCDLQRTYKRTGLHPEPCQCRKGAFAQVLYNRFLGRELGLCTEEAILEGFNF